MPRIAVIRVRGMTRVTHDIKKTLDMLKLKRKHVCVIVEGNESNNGMIKKVKDYITWGEIDDSVLKKLIEKRAEPNPKDKKRTKAFFRLSPPRGGFERKGTKTTFSLGGVLGYRGSKINQLIEKMI
ncbi:uL30 family ribosomal protein [Candidatus Woesearchaeota archaeon]|nr:uL30 family ribosomal protein [Candidatus Woesearchaeota archaeon]